MKILFAALLPAGLLLAAPASAQTQPRKPMSATTAPEYQSPTKPVEHGKAPGLQHKLLSDQGGVKTYVLIFAKATRC